MGLRKHDAGVTFGFYVFAWATLTGGLWFMFDMAEKALSAEARLVVGERIGSARLGGSIGSIPEQFATIAVVLLGLGTIANSLPDCVSLLETRWVIGRMEARTSTLSKKGATRHLPPG